jgi:hypothetical protein
MTADVQISGLRRITWSWLNDGTSGASKTIVWTTYLKHKLQATGNCVVTWTAPATADAELVLVIQGDGTLRTFTWPGTTIWESGVPPTLPTTSVQYAEIRGRYDGTNYLFTWGRFGY